MEYCNSYNGMTYHHSQQHSHEFRCGMKVGYNNSYNNLYGHNQHISWNGMHHNHHNNNNSHHHHNHHHHHNSSHPSHPSQQQQHHSPYGNRTIYDSYKANLANQNCFPSSTYSATNFESPYEPTTSINMPPAAMYRSRFGGSIGTSNNATGYQMCDVQQCCPSNNADNSRHTEYMAGLNGSMSRCIEATSNFGVADPRNHHQSYGGSGGGGSCSSGGGQESLLHHPHSMRMPTNHRSYESHHQKPIRPFDNEPPHQSWYGHGHPHNNINNTNNNNTTSETINESNHHYYQYHHHTLNNLNYNEYPQHIHNTNENQYPAGASNGQLVTAKEDKAPKMHRDRSLSKLVAMNRRLETQMNETERIDSLHHENFDNFDYYTDYSETPDSITSTSTSQFTNNDCMLNNATDTDSNNNVGALNNHHKNDCKETSSQQVTNEAEWLSTSTSTSTSTSISISTSTSATGTASTSESPTPASTITSPSSQSPTTSSTTITTTLTDTTQSDTCTESQADDSSSKPSVSSDEQVTKKSDLPSTKSPAKLNTNKKLVKHKKGPNENLMEKRRKRREKKSNTNFNKLNELKGDTIPLPGFQQAFGSTEIGRFSEIFFNASGSPIEIGIFESEADTLSPQPWEMGDSLEGPHFSMQPNNTPLNYAESLGSTDSPTASNNSFFSELRASEF